MFDTKSDMFGYTLSAIDFFDGCIDLDDYIKDYQVQSIVKDDFQKYSEINWLLNGLFYGMRTFGFWDGDLREKIKVFAIPCEVTTKIGFIFKQDNSGTTFVLSPVGLPHLGVATFKKTAEKKAASLKSIKRWDSRQ